MFIVTEYAALSKIVILNSFLLFTSLLFQLECFLLAKNVTALASD